MSELEVRNKIVFTWVDDSREPHEYVKHLRRPKGRQARLNLPKITAFLGKIAELQERIEKQSKKGASVADNMAMIESFFTPENEQLFPFILQMETEDELRILNEELTAIEVIEAVSKAATYIVEESLNRSEVQQALKKLGGEGVECNAA